MSYATEIYMNRSIARAAEALDLIDACKEHKLTDADSGKFKLLADQMRRAANSFSELAKGQSVYSADEFFKRALARAKAIRAERAVYARLARERREKMQAEREAIAAGLDLSAFAA